MPQDGDIPLMLRSLLCLCWVNLIAPIEFGKLGDSVVQEVDEQHHLGILRSVLNSTVKNTNERCSACRSAFYALNAVGSRFGSLHPTTSFKLYQSLCLPVLLYGAEISICCPVLKLP